MNFVSSLLLFLTVTNTSYAGTSWNAQGPNFKAIKALSISPQDTSVLYAGAFGWGVFKSTDGGTSWTNAKSGLTNTYVRSVLAISNATVFCGTNDGVFKTTDGGLTWVRVLTTTFSVRGLAHDVQTTSLYAATYGSGLFKSTDFGSSWTPLTVNDPVSSQTLSHQWDVAMFGRDSLYVGGSIGNISSGGALFSSIDGGISWKQVQRGIGIRSSVRSIAVSPNSPDSSLIIGTAAKGVYKSTNGGINWTTINGDSTVHPLADLQTNAVAFNTTGRYAGTDSVGGFFLRALGDTSVGWIPGTGLPGAQAVVSSIRINPANRSAVYVGTEGQGVYKSTDAGFAWLGKNSGMLGTAARVIKLNGNGQLILGTDFGDGLWISTNQGTSWNKSMSLATSNAITSIAITNTSAILYVGAYGSGVYKSINSGSTWTITDSTVLNHFVRTLSASPSNANIVFAGTGNGVYKTIDGGASWLASNSGIPASTSIRSMAIDSLNPNVIYAGTDSLYLFKTTNAGASWINYTNVNGFLPQDRFIRSITIDYSAGSTVYATADSGRIYKSTNSGSSWILLARLPATHSVRSLLIHPNDHKIFFAATFGDGIFMSADSGSHWQSCNTGIADQDFYALESDRASPLNIYAGSGMHGVYRTSFTFVNHAPALAPIGSKTTLAGSPLRFTVSASDSDSTVPSLSISNLPAGAMFVDSLDGRGGFHWTPTIGQIGDFLIVVHATDGLLSDSEQVAIRVLDPASSTLVVSTVEAGWNLLSVPVIPNDFAATTVFPQASSSAYGYMGSYVVEPILRNGPGYWLKFQNAQNLTLVGGTIDRETVAVRANWNLIGSLSHEFSVGFVTPISPVVISSNVFGYDGTSGYSIADSIKAGRGYWLKVNQAGSIVLSASPSTTQSTRNSTTSSQPATMDESMGTLSFEDRAGRTRILYIFSTASSPHEIKSFQLPPRPPAGSFDVRFSKTQTSMGLFDTLAMGQVYPIDISNDGQDLTLRWNVGDSRLSIRLSMESGSELSNYVLSGQGSSILPAHAGVTQAILSVSKNGMENELLPRAIALNQNYPNPFNPSTTIAYDLPARAHVHLVVYDLLGKQVAELVNGEQPPGHHGVQWNAETASSGVYYYRFDVVSTLDPVQRYRATKKMFLIR